MRHLLSTLVLLAWGLWFGGLITLFLAVQSLFETFHEARPVAGTGAAGIFHLFERYQLALAAVSLLLMFLWRLYPAAQTLKTAAFGLFALATIAAAVSTLFITPKIEALRLQGLTTDPQFAALHGRSMLLYVTEAGLLLLAGLLLPAIIRRDQQQLKDPSAKPLQDPGPASSA